MLGSWTIISVLVTVFKSFTSGSNKDIKTVVLNKNKKDLQMIFDAYIKNSQETEIVFSCGSGVTACVLALAYSLINDKYRPCIYDGSWAEYGKI